MIPHRISSLDKQIISKTSEIFIVNLHHLFNQQFACLKEILKNFLHKDLPNYEQIYPMNP